MKSITAVSRWSQVFVLTLLFLTASTQTQAFVTFETGQVRPLALSPDGNRLYAVNTPDNRLEIFDIKPAGLTHAGFISVGMEPVALAIRTNNEVWVVNHLSDSISIVDTGANPRVVRTLLVGDEPRDIVFAGTGSNRAFITTAHRGQNSPFSDPNDPGQITVQGIGRADVWVFDGVSPGTSLGGNPLTILSLFTDTPRALAVSPDGGTVYAAGFHTGNQTTAINEGTVCNGGVTAAPCNPAGGAPAPGGLPAPNINTDGNSQPDTALIVKFDGTNWIDKLNRNWNNQVRFSLPDKDVFAINANANPPIETNVFSGVGTILFNMAVNPATGKIYVANTEANNDVRFEGLRLSTNATTVTGKTHLTRITVLDGTTITPRHLNKHIDYTVQPAPTGVKDKSLAIPMGMAVTSDGTRLYLAAFGSNKIGIFDTAKLENNSFVPDANNHIEISGGGPSGLVLDETRNQLYVLSRFNNSVTIVDTQTKSETVSYPLHNPEPLSVVQGRPFLYNARLTSSNGESSCASCHVFGDFDSLAWDLGDPESSDLSNPNPDGPFPANGQSFQALKGPMTTQSLRGLDNHGPMHWRGDRTAARSGGNALDEAGAFKEFNVAFEGLLGNTGPLSTIDMDSFTQFTMQIKYPPNPNRPFNFTNSRTPAQQRGHDFFNNAASLLGLLTCNSCHELNPGQGRFGSSGLMSGENETQVFKIPHLRNMYQKIGMFGMPLNESIVPGDGLFMGDQIRGFGFLHDGSVDSLFRFHSTPLFSFNDDGQRRDVEQFMMGFDTDLQPLVGQQVTLTANNSAVVFPRLNILVERAKKGDCDLIFKGKSKGALAFTGGVLQGNSDIFQLDSTGTTLTESNLRNLVNTDQLEITYTCVPPGSGIQMGIDRDEDGVFDSIDICPSVANAGQQDSDQDGSGNACDNCTLVSNSNQLDSNGDGFGNACDTDLNNDGVTNGLDVGLFKTAFGTSGPDADFNLDGVVNGLDVGILKQFFGNAPGPSSVP